MRALRFLNLAILSILVASSAAVFAQDEKHDDNPPRQEEPKAEPKQDEAKPSRQDEAKPPRQDEMKTPRQDEAKPTKQDRQEPKQDEKQTPEQMRSAHQEPGRQENAQQGNARPAGKGGHIPDDKFRAQFGRSHTFKAQRPRVVNGQPTFQYGGYSFALVDAWPADWVYTDDCYIDYVDGEYFLFDLLHPGVRIALFVVL